MWMMDVTFNVNKMDNDYFIRHISRGLILPIYISPSSRYHSPYFKVDNMHLTGPYGPVYSEWYVDVMDGKHNLVCWYIVMPGELTFHITRFGDYRTMDNAIKYVEKLTKFMYIQLKINGFNPKDFTVNLPSGIQISPTMRRFGNIFRQDRDY